MRQLRVGLLGVTHPHTSGRVRALLEDESVEVVAGADEAPVAAAFFSHFGIPQVDADTVLSDPELDAVMIHSASADMAQLSIAAMRSGKAVLVEKPGGRTLGDLRGLADTAAETGRVCQVGYNFRASPAVAEAARLFEQGVLGEIVNARLHGGCSFDEAATGHVNAEGEMGGALWVIGSHAVDLALMYFGLPGAVNARVPKFDGFKDPGFREDAASITLSYPRHLVSIDFNSWDALPWIESWSVSAYGTNGEMHVTPLPDEVRLFLKETSGGRPAGCSTWAPTRFPVEWSGKPTDYSPEIPEVVNSELFKIEVGAFLDAVRDGSGRQPPMSGAPDAFAVAAVVAACYESSERAGAEVVMASNE